MTETPAEEAKGCLKGLGAIVAVLLGLSLITILFYVVFGDQEGMNNMLYGGEGDDGGEVFYIRFILIGALIIAAIIGIRYWRNTNKK